MTSEGAATSTEAAATFVGSEPRVAPAKNESPSGAVVFSDPAPEDFSLHAAFGAMTDPVLGNTYGMDQSVFAGIARGTDSPYIIKREGMAPRPSSARQGNSHKFDVEGQSAPVHFDYGSARFPCAAAARWTSRRWPATTAAAATATRPASR